MAYAGRHLKDILDLRLLVPLIGLSLLMIVSGIITDQWWLMVVLPGLMAAGWLVLIHPRVLYVILFFFIPLSMEIEVGGGLSTDLFGEPLLWMLTIITILHVIIYGIPSKLCNAVTIILVLSVIWMIVAAIFADDQVISIKYLVAKLWYILPFYFLPAFLFHQSVDLRIVFKSFLAGLLLAASYFFIFHWQEGLSYLSRTNAGQHVYTDDWCSFVFYVFCLRKDRLYLSHCSCFLSVHITMAADLHIDYISCLGSGDRIDLDDL